MNIQLIKEAEGWLSDCFSDLPADLTDEEIVSGVERHYEGGWKAFVAASTPINPDKFTHINLVLSSRMYNEGGSVNVQNFSRELVSTIAGTSGLNCAFLIQSRTDYDIIVKVEVSMGLRSDYPSWRYLRAACTTALNEMYTGDRWKRDFLYYSFADGDRVLESR